MTFSIFQPLRYYGVMVLFLVSQAGGVKASDLQLMRSSLDPQKHNQVREVGNALLMANRTFQADTDADQIHQQIHRVRQALETLTQPLPTQILTLSTEQSLFPKQKTRNQSSISTQWHQARRKQIAELDSALSVLQQYRNDFRGKYQELESGFFQRLSAWALSAPTDENAVNPVITSVSEAALSSLETLEDDVNAALAAPPKERHQQLTVLAQRLSFKKHAATLPESAQRETPTFVTRTSHR